VAEDFPRKFNDDYELLGELGKGGMGSVYKARQNRLNRIVAMKILSRNNDSEAEKRFYSEAQAMRELNHQNLATVFDFGTQDDKIFLAMTFVDGKPLSDIIKKKKRIPVKNAVYIAWQIASGLEYAHSHDVIHRDIKPSNIMITDKKGKDEVCIIDFGISLTSDTSRLTGTGMTMGTPEYMSPEQCHNKDVTYQSDIYNFGIVFYEMLAGDPPFLGGAPLAILNKHLHETPPSLRKKNNEVTPELENIIDKCLEKKRENRYLNFSEVIRDLRMIDVDPKSPTGKGTSPNVQPKHDGLILIMLGVLAALLLALIILSTLKKNPEPLPSINYLNLSKSCSVQNASKEKPCVIQTSRPEVSVAPLFDNSLNTAWVIPKNSAKEANGGVFLTIRLGKPTLITRIGFAIGDQKNWSKYSKPKEILVQYTNSTVKEGLVSVQAKQKILLSDKVETQYDNGWISKEVTDLTFELKSFQDDKIDGDFAISEIRIFGIELE